MPTSSTVDFAKGKTIATWYGEGRRRREDLVTVQTIPALTMVKLGPTGKMAITNNAGSVDVVADVVGYYTDV